MEFIYYDREPVRKCKLYNGDIVHYDVCGDRADQYDLNVFKYIGYGEVYTIDGIEQTFTNKHFFVKRR